MCAVRFGSYSTAATFAGMPRLSRLKSMSRYFCLWPPPMKRDVMRPLLLRPPVLGLPLVSDFSGTGLVMSAYEACVENRMPGDVGLYLFVAIVFSCYRLVWVTRPRRTRAPSRLPSDGHRPCASRGACRPSGPSASSF